MGVPMQENQRGFAAGVKHDRQDLRRFLDVEIEIAPGVLAPREETELLCLAAIERLTEEEEPLVIDMCCGSGNLGLAIATAVSSARVIGADLTDETVELARRNTVRLGLKSRVSIYQGDLFEALNGQTLAGKVDMIVCNPPYISTRRLTDSLAHLLEDEPREAFDGGPFGISILQRVIRGAVAFLKPDGYLIMEFGEGQVEQVRHLVTRVEGFAPPVFITNEEGTPRVVVARREAMGADRG